MLAQLLHEHLLAAERAGERPLAGSRLHTVHLEKSEIRLFATSLALLGNTPIHRIGRQADDELLLGVRLP